MTRRRFLRRGLVGAAAVLGAVTVGTELLDRGIVPGRELLESEHLDPGCWTPIGAPACGAGGATLTGSFWSRYRRREVGYTVGYPPGHGPGDRLPLVVMLHGFRGSHAHSLAGISPQDAVGLSVEGHRLTPMALVTVDGGNGYWHPHPGDDPMGMVVDELLPMLRGRGLGAAPSRVGIMGVSMGGFGALAMAEHHPGLFAAVAAISPAIFTTYAWVHYVNPGAFWSAGDFARYDAITHAAALARTPVRVACGLSDPFYPWVVDLVEALPPGADVEFAPGGHDGDFSASEQPRSLEFLARHLAP